MSESAQQRDPQPTGSQARRFSAFISYTHADERFAKRLHRELETYRLPRSLGAGSGPGRRLKAIFRDTDELAASYDLTTAVRDAIAQSDFLIVVCSVASAKSVWVGREIELFRSLHGDTGILAVIAEGEGEPAFHPALHGRKGGPSLEPLAADFRVDGGGRRLALLKLVAVMAGVRLDELLQRDLQRQVRRITAVAVGAVAGVAVVAGLAVVALNARADAALQRDRAGGLGDFMATDLRKGLEAAGRHDLLNAVNRAALNSYKGENLSRLTPEQLEQRATLLQGMGKDAEKRGDLTLARAQFEAAHKTTAALLAAKPNDPKRLFAHAQSEYWIGFVNWREGNAPAARAGFEAYAKLARLLVATDPTNDDWRMEIVYSATNLGMLALRQAGDPRRAEGFFRAASSGLETIARHRPNDPDTKMERSRALGWLADSQRLQGHLLEAAASREAQRRVLEAMLVAEPRNVEVRANLLSHDLAVARIAEAKGDAARAISLIETGRKQARDLESQDPDNKDFPKQARIFELFEARVWLSIPQRQRPSPNTVADLLGDCAILGPGSDYREISDFCDVLLARLRSQEGDRVGAAAALVAVQQRAVAQHDVLTARWGLNLADEARPVQVAENGGGMR